MARDDTKLSYYSGWDIDQLVSSDTVSVPVGTTAIFTLPSALPSVPVFEVLFRPTGFAAFYQAGSFSDNGTLAHLHIFSSYVLAGQVYITTDVAGQAKYFVWSDKVIY